MCTGIYTHLSLSIQPNSAVPSEPAMFDATRSDFEMLEPNKFTKIVSFSGKTIA